MKIDPTLRTRPLLCLALFFAAPLVFGCMLAPWVYLGVRAVAENGVFSGLAGERFERVATRTVQLFALLLIWPCLRYSGTLARVAPMLAWRRARGTAFVQWFVYGAASMIAVYAVGFGVGMYEFDPKLWGTARIATEPLGILVGALLVGVLEEYLFRGFVFGILRERWGVPAAAVASSALFSAIHFMRPRLPAPPDAITWTSGFELIPYMFTLFRPAYDWDFALTLFFMGVTLCLLFVRHRHLYGIAGLHAGWVWVLQSGNRIVNQQPRHHNFWFGWGDNPAQGAMVTFIAIGFAATAWILLCRARGDCQDGSNSDTTSA